MSGGGCFLLFMSILPLYHENLDTSNKVGHNTHSKSHTELPSLTHLARDSRIWLPYHALTQLFVDLAHNGRFN